MMKAKRWAVATVVFATAAYADISVNFTESNQPTFSNQQIAASTEAGLFARANWNNTTSGINGNIAKLRDASGIPTRASLTWSCDVVWGDVAAESDATAGVGDAQLARGYLDDGEPGLNLKVTEIPYSSYIVVLYLATDADGGTYHSFTVNGTDYSANGTRHTYRNPNWDASNTIIVKGLSGDLVVNGKTRARMVDKRGILCGFQIIEALPKAEPTIFSFSASRKNVVMGAKVKLAWMTYDATTVSIAPGVGEVAAASSTEVVVNADTTYTLTAKNGNGSKTQSITIVAREATGLVAYWNFEETTGTSTMEQISSTASGELPAGVNWALGGAPHSDSSLQFEGSGRLETKLNANDLGIAGSDAKTIVAWINTTTTEQDTFLGYSPSNGGIAGGDLRFLINADGGLCLEVSNGKVDFGSGYNDGRWHMVAFIIHAGDGIYDVDAFVDGAYTKCSWGGTKINTLGSVENILRSGNGFVLGSDGNSDRHYSGRLDDVAIYDRALTEAELKEIFVHGVKPVTLPGSP